MRTLAMFMLVGMMAAPVAAQGRGRNGAAAQGIPPGQLPPAGLCRVWYDGVPPGRQPGATNCDNAERIASRDARARVIYGAPRGGGRYVQRRTDRDGRNGRYAYNAAFEKGYQDGVQKGRDDAHGHHDADPVRHSWYRSGTRGYDNDYGSKEQYKNVYRNGFEQGYMTAYRQTYRR